MYVDLPGTLALSALWMLGITRGVDVGVLLVALLFLAVLYTELKDWMAREKARQLMQERINRL